MTYQGRKDVHTTVELEAATGYGYRTLRRWVVAGVLPQPTLHGRGFGRGVVALWSVDAMARARAAAALIRQGYSLPMVKRKLEEPPPPARRRRR
jgi:hypothetical protein